MNLHKQNFLFKCIVFEMESRYFKGGISFQDILNLIAYRYVDCKRFLEPDEFIEREGNLRVLIVFECVVLNFSMVLSRKRASYTDN